RGTVESHRADPQFRRACRFRCRYRAPARTDRRRRQGPRHRADSVSQLACSCLRRTNEELRQSPHSIETERLWSTALCKSLKGKLGSFEAYLDDTLLLQSLRSCVNLPIYCGCCTGYARAIAAGGCAGSELSREGTR